MFRDQRRVRQLLGLMILTSFTLITIDYRGGDDSPFRGVRRAAGSFFGPIERGVATVVRPVGNALSTLGNVRHLDKDLKKLKAERAEVLGQARRNADLQRQVEDMEKLLKVTRAGQYRTVTAHVIGAGPSNFTSTVTISVGTDDGIREDMTVMNSDGLVGRVIRASASTSDVVLITDAQSRVAARLSHSRDNGLVYGKGGGDLRFEMPNATADIQIGQYVLTLGTTYAPGIPIGTVKETRASPGAVSRTVIVKPLVNFSRLDLVSVVVTQKQESKVDPDVLVPPKPTPTPTPTATEGELKPCPEKSADESSESPSEQVPGATPTIVPCLSSYVESNPGPVLTPVP
jgi:rod shape-determining protein MreC